MLKNIKQKLEKWAVSTLYNQSFNQYHGRINKKKRKIIFDMFGAGLFRAFANPKQRLAISVLIGWYGYKCYEHNTLIPFSKTPIKIDHTWGEVQDIIRMYKRSIPSPAYLEFKKNQKTQTHDNN